MLTIILYITDVYLVENRSLDAEQCNILKT
jgi:hypothetical protein